MLTITTKKLLPLALVVMAACLDANAAATGYTTQQTRTAAPGPVNLAGVGASEGTSLSHARADHTHNLSGILPEAFGGTNAGALTCTNQFLSSNGSAYSCSTDTLAGPQHANQGAVTTLLHGSASGNPSWSAVSLTADVSGVLPEANGGTNAGALTCSGATPVLTSNGTAYSCSSVAVAGISGVLPEANGGTNAGALTCTALQGLTSNGTSYSCADNAVNTNSTLSGTGTSISNLGLNLTTANTWTGAITCNAASGAAFTGTGASGAHGADITGGVGSSIGAAITGGTPASGNGGLGASVTGGITSGNANTGAGGLNLTGTAGSAASSAGVGGVGGYAMQCTSTGNGGSGNGTNVGGAAGVVFNILATGSGGQGGNNQAGGRGGDLFNAFTLGSGGMSGVSGGQGGTGGGLGVWTLGTGGPPSGAGFSGGAGGGWNLNTGTGAAGLTTGGGGAGGSVLLNMGNGGNSPSGPGGAGGSMTILAGNAGTGGNVSGGDGLVITSGNGTGSGNNGSGLRIGTGTGATGIGRGYGIELTQNNTIQPHILLNSLTSDPSNLATGGLWMQGATSSQVLKIRNGGSETSTLLGTGTKSPAIQRLRVSGCATAATANAVCSTTVTWPSSFADANYTVTCTGDLITSGLPIAQGVITKLAASVTFQTMTVNSAAAQFTTIDCIAIHD